MSFRIRGLDPELFARFAGLDDVNLAQAGVERVHVTAKPDAPCRITLDDAEIGETVLLLSYEHQPVDTPYRQQGPIFVREAAARAYDVRNEIPPAMGIRLLSLRGFDAVGMMIEASVTKGADAESVIARFFENEAVAYIHAHYASRGCFLARIDRA